MPWIITAAAISYLIGSVPTGYLFGRILKGIDIRKFGSGNMGATNVLRVLGKKAGVTVLILDMLKGFLPVMFLGNLLIFKVAFLSPETLRVIIGLSCISGHNWTVFLNFKGGKGVATTIGVLAALAVKVPGMKLILALVLVTWLAVFIFSRVVSLASVVSGIAFPVYAFVFGQAATMKSLSVLLALFIILRHKSNLQRFLRGEEKRLF
ncbi:MAG: glycerol-3-phosphate 1-O-acyltransferase PlsY [Candidatus Omnitrophota bacterium]|nr:glycerol-3-phosphate 1-O-acyltransferase PlsY [Candidatus Omnitrophota bacterium]